MYRLNQDTIDLKIALDRALLLKTYITKQY